MGKVAQNSVKYVIEAELSSTGIVEKPDIVGAIFGQTEGLLGEDLDLRELQERGKVGRIDVKVDKQNGNSKATIKIPSSLDATETALLAAGLETIERVGPTEADITVDEIRDERTSKRDYIVKRAKQLLSDLQDDKPGKEKITGEIKQELRTEQISSYKSFKAGPEAESSDDVILVEGRADVTNLLKHGVKNAIALGGTDVPENIQEIGEEKKLTAFLDGDRGGDLILKELKEKADPDFVARAPENKEVEELGKEEVYSALRDRSPVKYENVEDIEKDKEADEETEGKLSDQLEQLIGTRAVHLLDEGFEAQQKIPVEKLGDEDFDECHAVVLDGKIDEDVVEAAENAGARFVAGMDKTGYANSSNVELYTREDFNKPNPEAN